jgi:WD40 repeat protein
VAFSPDGEEFIAAGDDGTLQLWDPRHGTPLGDVMIRFTGPLPFVDSLQGLAFSPDWKLAATSGDGWIQMWDTATDRPIGQPFGGNDGNTTNVAFSPDGTLLASEGSTTISFWDVTTHLPVGAPLDLKLSALQPFAFSPDGQMLAVMLGDGTLQRWDRTTRRPIGSPLGAKDDYVMALAFSPDGKLLATYSRTRISTGLAMVNGALQFWDAATGDAVGPSLSSGGGMGLVFSPNNSLLASTDAVGDVWLWDVAAGTLLADPHAPNVVGFDGFGGAAFTPDGEVLTSVDFNTGAVRLWNPATGLQVGEAALGLHIGLIVSPDGKRLASATAGDTPGVRVWDLFDVARACSLVKPYVRSAQIQPYLPAGQNPRACQLN